MARSAPEAPEGQMPLALELDDAVQPEAALRAAYRRVGISRRLPFERAMKNAALATCIRNLAEATGLLRARGA